MKYLDSAVLSMQTTVLTQNHVFYVKWGGVAVYTAAMLILYIIDMSTYPGRDDFTIYIAWISTTSAHVLTATH